MKRPEGAKIFANRIEAGKTTGTKVQRKLTAARASILSWDSKRGNRLLESLNLEGCGREKTCK